MNVGGRPNSVRTSRPAFPRALGPRLDWSDVPEPVRLAIEVRLGAKITDTQTRRDGFTRAFAGIVTDASGAKTFLKTVGPIPNPSAPEVHRREIRYMSQLPPGLPVPRLLWSHEQDGWVTLALEPIDGHSPRLPWHSSDLERVFAAWKGLSERLTPAPSGFPALADDEQFGWRSLQARAKSHESDLAGRLPPWVRVHLQELVDVEAEWHQATVGRSLLHGDLRAENILLTKDDVFFVDWPNASVGARWVDILCMLPSVAVQGGPPPWKLWGRVPGTEDVPVHEARAMLAAISGYWAESSLKAAPPDRRTLRAYQKAQGDWAVAWLRKLI